jgi:hypothetical protein
MKLQILFIILFLSYYLLSCEFQSHSYPSDIKSDPGSKPKVEKAKISGKVSYPSEGVPDDLIVVIKNIENGSTFQIRNWDRISLKYSAELDAPGNYEVYAITDEMKGYKAYYSEFVRCGMNYDCPSHKPVVLRLSPGTDLNGIDPGDWYAD